MLKYEAAQTPIRPPFDEEIIEYLDSLSKYLLRDKRAKKYTDVITFAFWCRKASILQLKTPYENIKNRIGRGLVFHIAPSNVAVNFAYSMVAGLLAGNANIIRLPSKQFEQVDIICKAINDTLPSQLEGYIQCIHYGHEKAITDEISALCDARIIWGGDQTIGRIRQSHIKPRAVDIAFADRYSIAVINSDFYLANVDKKKTAQAFYNDTYLSDQNACTSPKLVVWTGTNVEQAKEQFWRYLHDYVSNNYTLQGVQATEKLSKIMFMAAQTGEICQEKMPDNLITCISISELTQETMNYCGNSGFFLQYHGQNLKQILPILGEKCQTLSYIDNNSNQLNDFIFKYRPKGVDRIVPVGKTMDFALVWDGYDLIYWLTRAITGDKT